MAPGAGREAVSRFEERTPRRGPCARSTPARGLPGAGYGTCTCRMDPLGSRRPSSSVWQPEGVLLPGEDAGAGRDGVLRGRLDRGASRFLRRRVGQTP